MANLQQFAVTRNGSVTINNFPRYTITGRLEDVNPETGLYEATADFTGANAITFPGELANRTPEQRDAIIMVIARMLVEMKAGVWMGQ
jgi:hypothetical protein